jgi:RHS repeat-associated protein
VQSTINGVTTTFIGSYYEKTGNTETRYYFFNGARIAMRNTGDAAPTYIHGDQLGSATNTTGQSVSSERYLPYGAIRGTSTVATPYRYTGQREEASFGLYYYNARWYDPVLGRFIQADTIVPQPANGQSWNRYTYAANNPLRYCDPTGRVAQDEAQEALGIIDDVRRVYQAIVQIDFGWVLLEDPFDSAVSVRWDEGDWLLSELKTLQGALGDLASGMLGYEAFRNAFGVTQFTKGCTEGNAGLTTGAGVIRLADGFSRWTVAHEMGHSVDYRYGGLLSVYMGFAVGAYYDPIGRSRQLNGDSWYNPGATPPPCGVDGNFNHQEDFAEAVAAHVYPDDAQWRAARFSERRYHYDSYPATARGQFIKALLVSRW